MSSSSNRELNPKVHNIRKNFPILNQKIHSQRLAYLDNAATTQKPKCVIEAYESLYKKYFGSVHRSIHYLSEQTTLKYEHTRKLVQEFINANDPKECIFVRSATEAINLVAQTLSELILKPGDEVVITQMEHHSNIVPWQVATDKHNAKLKYIPINQTGDLDLTNIDAILSDKVKILAITYVSNVLGTINPLKEIIKKAHAKGIQVVVDAAQATPHLKVDVKDLDCDYLALSAHKMYGPTGVGVLYGKEELLNALPPYQTGGSMITEVYMDKSYYAPLPHKFEAGTPCIAEVIAFGACLEYLNQINLSDFFQIEHDLLQYAKSMLHNIDGLTIIGDSKNKIGVISFELDGIHPHDIGTILDKHGVAIRAGHHCAMPIMDFYDVAATARISLGIYNDSDDIEQLVDALKDVKRVFKK